MKLIAPCDAPDFELEDINGELIKLSGLRGKPVILSFFRDVACPFCNLREHEYSQRFKQWNDLGIEVIGIFSSSKEELREFISQHPRPFRAVADPDLKLYDQFGLSSSFTGFIWALLFKFPQLLAGVFKGGKLELKKNNATLMPADFLLGFDGQVVDLWYARDIADHMPMRRIERFVSEVKLAIAGKQPLVMKSANHEQMYATSGVVAQNRAQQSKKVYT